MINIPKDTLMMENKTESEEPPNTNKNLVNNDPQPKKTIVNGEIEEKDSSVDGKIQEKNTSVEGVIKGKESSIDGEMKEKDTSVEGVDGAIKGSDSSVDGVIKGKDSSVDGEIKKKVTSDEGIDGAIKGKDSSVDGVIKGKDSSIDDEIKEKDTSVEGVDGAIKGKDSSVDGVIKGKDSCIDSEIKEKETSIEDVDGSIKGKDSSVDGVIKGKDSSIDGKIKEKETSIDGVDGAIKGKDSSVDGEIKEDTSVKGAEAVIKAKDSSIDGEIKEKDTSVEGADGVIKAKDSPGDDEIDEKDTSVKGTESIIKEKDSSVDGKIKENETSVDAVDKVKKSTEPLKNLRSPSEDLKEDKEDKNSSSNNSNPKVVNKNSEDNNVTDAKSPSEKSDETSSEKVNTSSSDIPQTKITKETISQNGLSKPNLSKKKENSSSGESRPDTPMSHGSLDLDLEEKLLHIDADLAQDDQDDFCEEKLLLESDEEFTLKDKGKEEEEEEVKSSENESLFDNGEKSLSAGKTDEASTDRQEKEIEKILKSFNSSLENKNADNNAESTTFRKIIPSNDNLKVLSNSSENSNSKLSEDAVFDESGNNSNSNTGKRKFLDTNSSNSSSLVKRKSSDAYSPSNSKITAKRKLSDSSNLDDGNNSLVKAKLPNLNLNDNGDSNNSNKLAKPNNKLSTSSDNDGKSSQGEHETKTKPKVQSEKNTNKTEITFSEALKSIAMEDNLFKSIAMEDNLLQDKPQPLIPTTEITNTDTTTPPTSSLTLLQPVSHIRSNSSSVPATDSENDSQGKKRSLPGNFDSLKPDLKKIRFFKDVKDADKTTSDSIKEGETETLVDEDETSSQELSRKIKQSTQSRLQEEKECRDLKSGTTDKDDDFDAMDENDLQRKTVEEMHKNLLSDNKLRRIKRKDLESLIIELFVDKVLYEHQLGQHKDLCKRLETTLESTRKKAAQFHKEIEDLKKVTHRLQAEHLARKSQLVAPVKVKRSVGIQATPTIIGKGLMNVTSHSSIRVLTPSAASSTPTISKSQVSKNIGIGSESQSSNSSSSSPLSSLSSTPSAQDRAKIHKPRDKAQVSLTFINDRNKSTQHPSVGASAKTVNLTAQQQTPGTQVMVPFVVQQSQNGSVGSQFIPVTTTRIVRTPLTPINSSTTQFSTASLPSSVTGASVAAAAASNTTTSSFIDLTDDDEAARNQRASLQAGGLVAVQRATAAGVNSSGQFVTLNPPSSVGQILLVPSPNGQATTALVVGSVANTSNASGVVRTTIAQNSGVRISSPVGIVQPTRAVVGAQMNGGTFVNPVSRHPAPLPRAPPQQTSGYSKKLPPLPTLKLSHKDNSIVLSWNMAKTDEHERIASYQIYAYQEGTAPPTPTLWKKVGSVKALELPMACTLTQFMPGHVYHFAVRAVDIRSRLGPFSDPKSIRLGN